MNDRSARFGVRMAVGSVLTCVLAFGPMPAANAAPILGLDITTGSSVGDPNPLQTLGWEFSLAQPITLTALGIWDGGPVGLVENHLVAIWTTAGDPPLATVLVTNASTPVGSTEPAGRWLFQDLAVPLALVPGTYVLGADYPTNLDQVRVFASHTTAPGIAFVGGRFTNPVTPGFDFPNTPATPGFDGPFGPNLLFLPEPSTLALIGLAMLGMEAWVRRRVVDRGSSHRGQVCRRARGAGAPSE